VRDSNGVELAGTSVALSRHRCRRWACLLLDMPDPLSNVC